MDDTILNALIEKGGQYGPILAAALFYFWRLNGKVNELRDTLVQRDMDSIKARLVTIENQFSAIQKALVQLGAWTERGEEKKQ